MRCFVIEIFKSKLHAYFKPQKFKFYSYGSKIGNMLITRLRVDRSYLNSNGFYIGLNPSPQCSCGQGQETIKHIFISCDLYNSICKIMFDKVGQLISAFSSLNRNDKTCLLLYGFKPDNSD